MTQQTRLATFTAVSMFIFASVVNGLSASLLAIAGDFGIPPSRAGILFSLHFAGFIVLITLSLVLHGLRRRPDSRHGDRRAVRGRTRRRGPGPLFHRPCRCPSCRRWLRRGDREPYRHAAGNDVPLECRGESPCRLHAGLLCRRGTPHPGLPLARYGRSRRVATALSRTECRGRHSAPHGAFDPAPTDLT
jgi:hypothetical protein